MSSLGSCTNRLSAIYPAPEAREIAMRLLEFHSGYSRARLLLQEPLPEPLQQKIELDMVRLLTHEPIQYVLSEAYFYGDKFFVNQHVLIPRRETEELIALIIADLQKKPFVRIVDVGTGSGCIAIALAKHLPNAELIGIDISSQALEVAKQNANYHQVNVQFIQADVFADFYQDMMPFDVMVSNPPYVTETEKKVMMPSVTDFEPSLALFVPDNQPLLYYERLAKIAQENLPIHGLVYWEINENFGYETQKCLQNKSFDTWLFADMQGKHRFIRAIKK